jgi:Ca2+/Na+ antiporter
VTLLALGNGAPDLSSSIAAVGEGHYELAINALLGARHTYLVYSWLRIK